MTLYQVLAMNERLLVWADEENGMIYTWNQSATFQVWSDRGVDRADPWVEADIRTNHDRDFTFETAREYAKEWACE